MSKRILVTVVLFCIPNLSESADLRPYLGGSIGQDVEIEAAENVGSESSDPSFRLFGGIGIGENFAVEIAYHDFGTTTCCGPTVADLGFERNGDGPSASVVGIWPIRRFRLFARAGALWWRVDGHDLTIAGRRVYSNDGVDLAGGIGGDVAVAGGLRVRLDWDFFEIDGDGVNAVSIGALWQF